MGFKIVDFYEQALLRDFSRKYQLRVIGIGGRLGPEDNVFIETASLPGYRINNIETPFMGMRFNIPGSAQFEGSANWTVRFRCDLNFDIRGIFEEWQRQVFNAVPDLNITNIPSSTGYYHIPDVSQTIRLGLHDRNGTFYRKYMLVGVYPVNIGAQQYDQTDQGTLQTLEVSLAYQYWELESVTDAGNEILEGFDNVDVDTNLGSTFA